jgi:hypothetical protein
MASAQAMMNAEWGCWLYQVLLASSNKSAGLFLVKHLGMTMFKGRSMM